MTGPPDVPLPPAPEAPGRSPGAPNLILTGFMGSGKTRVGERLAARLDRPFLDFDARLAAQFGRPVARIFSECGEATFRAAEAALCHGLLDHGGLVVATGGGTVVDPVNRAALESRGVLICLTAAPDTLLARVLADGAEARPLLGPDPPAAVRRLLDARAAAYAAIRIQVDTTDLTVDGVVQRVLALYESAVRGHPAL